uniref:Secreted protein n=1 Tax=Macrostomum lignano TaxID=282301 RepID=A0A1I8FEZ7_9PLAT
EPHGSPLHVSAASRSVPSSIPGRCSCSSINGRRSAAFATAAAAAREHFLLTLSAQAAGTFSRHQHHQQPVLKLARGPAVQPGETGWPLAPNRFAANRRQPLGNAPATVAKQFLAAIRTRTLAVARRRRLGNCCGLTDAISQSMMEPLHECQTEADQQILQNPPHQRPHQQPHHHLPYLHRQRDYSTTSSASQIGSGVSRSSSRV